MNPWVSGSSGEAGVVASTSRESEGLITAVPEARAKANIKNLANDILHDPWFEVTADEYRTSHGFVRKVIECFYDDRPTAEALLRKNQRI